MFLTLHYQLIDLVDIYRVKQKKAVEITSTILKEIRRNRECDHLMDQLSDSLEELEDFKKVMIAIIAKCSDPLVKEHLDFLITSNMSLLSE